MQLLPDGMLAAGTPARIVREVSGSAKEWVEPGAMRGICER